MNIAIVLLFIGILLVVLLVTSNKKDSSSSDSGTTSPTNPTEPIITGNINTSFYGCLGNQIVETKGFVTRLWMMSWSYDFNLESKIDAILEAKLPTTLDLDQWLYSGLNIHPEAEKNLIDLKEKLIVSGAYDYIFGVELADELNLAERNLKDTIPTAVALVRKIFPDKRLRAVYSGAYPWYYQELFDDIGADHFRVVDKVVVPSKDFEGNIVEPLATTWLKSMKPNQGLILIPGGAEVSYDLPNPQLWIDYAKEIAKTGRYIEICGFAWRVPPNSPGINKPLVNICDQPDIKSKYISAFSSVGSS